jgi:hypothetical protein
MKKVQRRLETVILIIHMSLVSVKKHPMEDRRCLPTALQSVTVVRWKENSIGIAASKSHTAIGIALPAFTNKPEPENGNNIRELVL